MKNLIFLFYIGSILCCRNDTFPIAERSSARVELSPSDLIGKVQEYMDGLCETDDFSGTVLIAKGDQVLYEKACGEASKRFHVANNLDTKFNLGSMNKMFTATAIMQLVEKGLVQLSDPIGNYVDESWLPKEITHKVTVHHLLTHTSGLGSYFNSTYWNASRELYRSVNDFKPLVRGDTLAFEPGEKFQYSNTGMLLLGVVIEKATGQDYFEYIRQNIYIPAGMVNSDAYEMDRPVENLAIGYISSSDKVLGWENNLYKHVIKGGPAGGGFSTVRDLQRFANALTSEKLVSKSSLDLLWRDYTKSRYGYGFQVKKSGAGKVVGHGGGFPGLSSNLDIFLGSGYVVVVMSNYDRGAVEVSRKIYHWIEKS
ncbi:serine hydrolase domain-containing protein [Flavobacteriaceae bacterium 3-367]|uniref:serine hydrolase domain-containing protein n=1 Tax=Eudoraea algarum TaxID=3417568 RepID=UPI003281E2E3